MSNEVIIGMDMKTYEKLKHMVEKQDQYKKESKERMRIKRGTVKSNKVDSDVKWNLLTPIQQTIKSN